MSTEPANCLTTVSMEAIPRPALLVSPDGVVLGANADASHLFGLSCDELRAKRIGEILGSGADVPFGQSKLPTTLNLQVRDGRLLWVESSVGVDRGDPAGPRYLILLSEISRQIETRQERDRLLNIAGVGAALPALLHEIRSPLASITAAVELLVEDMDDSPVREQLHAVLSEVRRMRLSLDGVLTVGRRMRSNRFAAIDQACRHAWQIMSARARTLGIFSRCVVDDMPLLPLDPAVVGGIVHNLMINAIQACTAGQAVNLYAGLQDEGRRFTLTVVDNGAGMSKDVHSRCTEMFFTTKRNGSGIGLALCRQAVEEAGGTLAVESVIGFGTSVTIEVSLQPVNSGGSTEEPPTPGPISSPFNRIH